MKTWFNQITLILLLLLFGFKGEAQHYDTSNNDTRALDVKVIIEQINGLKVKNATGVQRVIKGDSIIEFSPLQDGFFTYTLKNTHNGSLIDVSGNLRYGYTKQYFRKNDHYVDVLTYYGDGKIKSAGKIYIDSLRETTSLTPSSKIKFPVGIKKSYDINGKLNGVIDYDRIFIFSFKDVVQLLMGDGHIKINNIDVLVFNDGKGVWQASYESVTKGLSYLEIDGKNGKLLKQMHHMKMIE